MSVDLPCPALAQRRRPCARSAAGSPRAAAGAARPAPPRAARCASSAYSSSSQVRSWSAAAGAEHAGPAHQLEQRALGPVGGLVVDVGHERARSGLTSRRRGGRVLVRPSRPRCRGRCAGPRSRLSRSSALQTVWIVSPPAGAKEIAQAAVLSASDERDGHRLDALERPLVEPGPRQKRGSARGRRRAMRSWVVRRSVRRSGRGRDVGRPRARREELAAAVALGRGRARRRRRA